nr:hypothetical protein [Actinopolyspora mortivallis]
MTLNTNRDEVAVCNLESVNLARHVTADGLDHERLRRTTRTTVRMLDTSSTSTYERHGLT